MTTEVQVTRSEELIQMMTLFGATGRISDITGKVGYNKIVDLMDSQDIDKLKLLHKFLGWGIEYLDLKARKWGER